jgi:hypothetical protein
MREIISPFRNRAAKEDADWVINPERVKNTPKEEKVPRRQHLSNFIFNDSPDNNYEVDLSHKGSIHMEEDRPLSMLTNPHVLDLSQRKKEILNNSPTKGSNVNLTIIEQLKQRRLKQLEEQKQEGKGEVKRDQSPLEEMVFRILNKQN